MIEIIRRHLLGYALSAAVALAVLRLLVPDLVDFFIDLITIGLVWLVVELGRRAPEPVPAPAPATKSPFPFGGRRS